MNAMSIQSVVALFPETKSQIEEFALSLVNSALDGEQSAMQMEVRLAAMENVVKTIRGNKDFKEAILNEAERYGEKTIKAYNAQFQIKETGVKYDYSQCNHPLLERLNSTIEDLTEQKKTIENLLKNIKVPTKYIDTETGEEVELMPAFRTSTTQVVTTLNK